MGVKVTLHFVPKAGRAPDLEGRLRALGFRDVGMLPGLQRLVLRADPDEIAQRLGVSLDSTPREQRVGPVRRRVRVPTIPNSARLPAAVEQLVERWYVPLAPDRLKESY